MQKHDAHSALMSYEDRHGDYPIMNRDEFKGFGRCMSRFLFTWLVVVLCVMVSAFSIDPAAPQAGALASSGICTGTPAQRNICVAPAPAAQVQNPLSMSL